MILAPCLATVTITTYCAYTDWNLYKIYNYVTIPFILLGIFYHALWANGISFSLLGMLWGIALLLAAIFTNSIGAGDGKLIMALGAWLGWASMIPILILAFMWAAVWLLKRMLKQHYAKIPFAVCLWVSLLLFWTFIFVFIA